MTIAGSDSGSGAGIEADLKTFSALGVYGTCVITAVTAQNTTGVYEIFPIPANIVKSQIETVLKDIKIEVAKTGMLYTGDVIGVVSEAIDRYSLKVIVDPVLKAGTGEDLIVWQDVDSLIDLVISKAYLVTPNLYEAEVLSGIRIKNLEDMKKAAVKIKGLGAKAVLVKGGHLEGRIIHDVLYKDRKFKIFRKHRIDAKPHGGGCSFSAAITGYLSLGENLLEAISKAELFIDEAIRFGLRVGKGKTPVNPLVHLYNEADKMRVLLEVEEAAQKICRCKDVWPFIAEVGTQIGMALKYASSKNHIAAIDGRIVKCMDGIKAAGNIKFGASHHIANLLLQIMRYSSEVRAAINLHYTPRLIKAFKKAGYVTASFDRAEEPIKIKVVEGETLKWAVDDVVKRLGKVPDLIYDLGEVGKEPMIRVLGKSAIDALRKILEAISFLEK
ncbi:TPA: bifunctional hydroxymethylpyrimidine kinase/phosphomethylpyrimidine kinase [Candidatus Bathyarchaeota archaeon]|nr:bifunctional hydroxymethylpyrimidine kinase/phosphomethylpyrimidine kinase [Candidatus Bathyarchaeota archaeon]